MREPAIAFRPKQVLYVEDEENDFYFLKTAFLSAPTPVELLRARDGTEAKATLRERAGHFDAVITDLRMPLCTGYDLLEWLRDNPALRTFPVYVLSTSALGRDSEVCTRLGASRYFTKPTSPKGYAHLAREILSLISPASL